MFKKTLVILIVPCLFLFLLGLWQLFRFKSKDMIIEKMNLPVIHLLPNSDLIKFNYRQIKIDGILSGIEIYVFAGRHGYHALSPMLLSNGYYIMVNKGIIKEKKKKEEDIEKISVSGILCCNNNKKNSWLIKNDIDLNTWFTLNTEEISNELGIKLEQCMLWQKYFGKRLIERRTKHLEYAITWFALSLIWCLLYFFRQNKSLSK